MHAWHSNYGNKDTMWSSSGKFCLLRFLMSLEHKKEKSGRTDLPTTSDLCLLVRIKILPSYCSSYHLLIFFHDDTFIFIVTNSIPYKQPLFLIHFLSNWWIWQLNGGSLSISVHCVWWSCWLYHYSMYF